MRLRLHVQTRECGQSFGEKADLGRISLAAVLHDGTFGKIADYTIADKDFLNCLRFGRENPRPHTENLTHAMSLH